MSFQSCSGFTINGGSFTNSNHVLNVRIIRKSVVANRRKGKKRTIWDDYSRVKPGDVHIEESICTTSVKRGYIYYDEEGRKQYHLWRDVDARRNLGLARLRGEDKEDKFLYITYDGPDALKAFKQDFYQFAHIKKVNVAQVFGYNDNKRGLPALIFYDALIPLGSIITKDCQFLPLLYSYFAHQLGRMQREISVGQLLLGELWVDPRTGALRQGPYIELPFLEFSLMLSTDVNAMLNTHSNHLLIQTYKDNDTVFEYLIRTFTAQSIFTGIRWSSGGFIQTLDNQQVIPVLSVLPGAIYNRRSRDIIARLPVSKESQYYKFWRVWGGIPDAMRESQVVMGDGSVRFTVTSTEIQNLQGIELQYTLNTGGKRGTLVESWLAQAPSVFGQLKINEDDWKDYASLGSFILHLRRTSSPKEPIIPPNVYLFIRPVPRPSDGEAIWRSWVEDEKYSWSFDSLGSELVPGVIQGHPRLPSFTSSICSWHFTWSPSHYSAVQKLQISEGFDTATTAFALSFGLPTLEVVGD